MNKIFILILFSFFISGSVIAGQDINYPKFGIETQNGLIPHGLKPGDKAPDFSGYDQNGKQCPVKKDS